MIRKMLACCLMLGLSFGPIIARQEKAGGEDNSQPEKKAFGPLQKSLLLPGWGQLAEKRVLEGIVFLTAEAVCWIGIVNHNHRGNENYALYKAAETTDDAVRYRRLTEDSDRRRNQFLLAAAAVWAANLIDISLIVKNHKSKDQPIEFKIAPDERRLFGLKVACRF